MQFIVVDRATLQRGIVVKSPYIILSIRDPGRRKPRIQRGAGLCGVLALAFDDCEPMTGRELPEGARPMTRDEAEGIWQFVELHLDKIGAIVCQCEDGLSRAPAIAAALADALGQDGDVILAEGDPNRYVYDLMTQACAASDTRIGK